MVHRCGRLFQLLSYQTGILEDSVTKTAHEVGPKQAEETPKRIIKIKNKSNRGKAHWGFGVEELLHSKGDGGQPGESH